MIKHLLTCFVLCLIALTSFSQKIDPPSEGKAVVYFVRVSSMGFAINFSYFDQDKLIGRFNGPKYIRYECEPGEHLFWARSENKDFIHADLEAGKIYFVEAIPQMGALKAGVKLVPLDPANSKTPKKMGQIKKLMAKKPSESFSSDQLKFEEQNLQDVVEKGMKKYEEEKLRGEKFLKLEKNMFYQE